MYSLTLKIDGAKIMSAYKVPRKKSKTGHVWAYSFRHAGKQYKKEGFPTKKRSMEAEALRRAELKALPYHPPTITLGDLVGQYLQECATIKGLAENTVNQKRFVFTSFLEFLAMDAERTQETDPADTLTKTEVKGYLKARARISGNCAANRDKKEIKALYNWANDEDIIFYRNPCKGIKPFPEDEFQKYVPPKGDILKVKLQATGDEQDFIECIYDLLGRRREIRYLKWQDINFQTRWVDLFTRKKGGGLKCMPKPMTTNVMKILERRQKKVKGRPLYVFDFSLDQLNQMMKRLCKQAEVPPFGFHALRHHAATTLLENDVPIKQIQFLLGHEKVSTTETYLHVMSGDFHSTVELLQDKALRSATLNTLGK